MITALVLQSPALACGGFFCNAVTPIDQAGEEIVFEIDEVSGTTNMHVRVQYQGPATEFAWLVPVAEQPTLGVGTDQLFNALEPVTRPTYGLNITDSGDCTDDGWSVRGSLIPPPPAPSQSEMDTNGAGGVTVVQQAVGPYDTAVITGDSEQAVLDWLQDNDYAIPDTVGDRLAPYIADRHYLVALKLQSDQDTGDLVPITLSYESTTPVVPLTLTGIAATADMPLRIYLLGGGRAVPTNYLHVVVNDAAVDWFRPGGTFGVRGDLVSRAADEAGGQAFATDFAGDAAQFVDTIHRPGWTSDGLEEATTPSEFANLVNGRGFVYDSALTAFFEDQMPLSDPSMSPFAYQCPGCVDLDSLVTSFDAGAAKVAFENRIVTPIREAAEMFERNQIVTRLASSASPEEMTLDPQFGINPSMPTEVDRARMADLYIDCDPGEDSRSAPMVLTLADGQEIFIPSLAWLAERGLTPSDWIASLEEPYAVRIEETSTTGQPNVIFDGRDIVEGNVDDLNEDVPSSERASASGCGCNASPMSGAGLFVLALVGLVSRRR